MEFKTTQGGETTLVFDEGESLQLDDLAKRQNMKLGDVMAFLQKQKQAHPLAEFDQLLSITFPQLFHAGGIVPVPADLKTKKKLVVPPPDPLAALEQDIRRKLMLASAGSVGATSQMQQVEATLLQALATVLLAQRIKVGIDA